MKSYKLALNKIVKGELEKELLTVKKIQKLFSGGWCCLLGIKKVLVSTEI